MIKKLRIKFILIATLSVAVVVLLVVGSINIMSVGQSKATAEAMLQYLSENDGAFPERIDALPPEPDAALPHEERPELSGKEVRYKTRYFSVTADELGNITATHTEYIAAVDDATAAEYAAAVISSDSSQGVFSVYRYISVEKSYGRLLIFLDCEEDFLSQRKLLLTSLLIGGASLLFVFVLVTILSGRAIRPVAESIEKQKRFITDASHEIKTPISIISAAADVMQLTDNDNEWVASIKNQTTRLTKLVNNLVALAKMDEDRVQLNMTRFNISDAVYDAAAPFELLAQQHGRRFELQLTPALEYTGDEASIRQLVSILTDNAIKYATDGGDVTVSLTARGKGIQLRVSNAGVPLSREQLSRLFDRFYRVDDSRARQTGGYGIGLSIAQAIVNAHHGRITAECDEHNIISFSVQLPN